MVKGYKKEVASISLLNLQNYCKFEYGRTD